MAEPSIELVSCEKAFSRLIRLWLIGILPCLVLVIRQALMPAFKQHGAEFTAPFLPLLFPIPTFLIGKRVRSQARVAVSRYRTAMGVSIAYLLALTSLPLLLPLYGFVIKDMVWFFCIVTTLHGFAAVAVGNALEG